MTGETFFQLHYHLTDTERLFDLAQGIAARRRRLKKHDARCRRFSWYARGLLRRGIAFLILAAVLGAMTVLLKLGGVSGAMAGLCFGCGVTELVLRGQLQRSYRRSWQQFRQQNGPDGTVSFDADGIREENEKGRPTHFDWADWDVCVMTQKVIVLTFRIPVLLFFPYSREAAITVEHAAQAFGKEDSLVYRRAAGNM